MIFQSFQTILKNLTGSKQKHGRSIVVKAMPIGRAGIDPSWLTHGEVVQKEQKHCHVAAKAVLMSSKTGTAEQVCVRQRGPGNEFKVG